MADKKISQLTAAAPLTGTEILPIVQGGQTVQTTAQDIADLGGGSGVQGVTGFGVDNTDPLNPIVNSFTEGIITATGTNRNNAAFITSFSTIINAGALNTGVRLPNFPLYGHKYYICNNSGTNKNIYCFQNFYVNNILVAGAAGIILNDTFIFSFTFTSVGWLVNQEQVAPYKVYSAEFSQSGTSAPTVVIKQNEIGNIVWTRSGAGDYRGTLTGAFSSANFLTSQIIYLGNNGAFGGVAQAFITKVSNDQIRMLTQRGDLTNVDNLLINSFVEIRVYN